MINDHTHIKMKNGDICTTRGFCDEKRVFVVPLYFKNPKGDKILNNARYEKFVDEFLERYKHIKPGSIFETSYGKRMVINTDDIEETYDPFGKTEAIFISLNEAIYKRVIESLSKFVPLDDIGFIGSSLVGFDERDESDLDLIIRGLDNYKIVRENFNNVLSNIGAECGISQKQYDKSIVKYSSLFNSEFNDFGEMIKNRWSTIYIPEELFCKIRFTYNPIKENPFFAPEIKIEKSTEEIKGTVVKDSGTSFMPRHFDIKTESGEIYRVITYYWDYSCCVANLDQVKVFGYIDRKNNVISISDTRKHGVKFDKLNYDYCPIT